MEIISVLFYKRRKKIRRIALISCQIIGILQFVCIPYCVLAQKTSYEINKNDILEISFWESPEMNRQLRVDSEGNITLPVIGSVNAEGLTVDELSQGIIRQMGMYNKLINQVSIKVLEFGQNEVHVTGQVITPGKYSFEEIPNLWDIILEAGGPLEGAQLDEVVIVRNQEDGRIITANITHALRSGEVNELPAIYPGDAIHVPGESSPFGVTPVNTTNYSSRNEYYITGAIGTPGTKQFENNLNLLDAIGQAGGPTSEANLEEVKYISVYNEGTFVMKLDLEYYMNNSISSSLPLVSPGSTIFIPTEERMSPVLSAIIITTVSTTLSTVLVIYLTEALR
jgi:polysaccharide export outer membrane protein